MIPFENEASLTPTEEAAREVMESNWENVIRTSPAVLEDFQEKYPKACELVSRKVEEEGVEGLGNVFRPGVPDFLAFDDDGSYCFIEVKGEGDGLRHSQHTSPPSRTVPGTLPVLGYSYMHERHSKSKK